MSYTARPVGRDTIILIGKQTLRMGAWSPAMVLFEQWTSIRELTSD